MVDKICGIYKITSPSSKIYIGSSKDIKSRWSFYKRLHSKKQLKIYNSFCKYGVDTHTFEIIEECEFDQLFIRERYWQEFYNCVEKGLNCSYVKTDEKPKIVTKETKKKQSDYQKSKWLNKIYRENNSKAHIGKKAKKVNQYDLNMNFIKEWVSMNQASVNLKIPITNIHLCCKNKKDCAGGFIWRLCITN